jgi:chromosome segregation ATPase
MKRAILLAILLHASVAGAVFKCVDLKGVTRIGETPPDECNAVVMYEIRPNGSVARKIDPTPSPDQVKARNDEEARKREADKVLAIQKRKDDALLSTFSNEREFDVTRDRNIEPIKGRIRGGEERIKLIEERETKLAEHLEFYKQGQAQAKGKGKQADGPPPAILAEQESLAKEKEGLRAMIVRQRKEIDDLRARYDTDKQRWIALKSGRLDALTAPAPASAQAPAAAAPQPVRKTY